MPLPTTPTHWSLEMHCLFFKICVVVNFSFNLIIVKGLYPLKSADTLFGVCDQFAFNLALVWLVFVVVVVGSFDCLSLFEIDPCCRVYR